MVQQPILPREDYDAHVKCLDPSSKKLTEIVRDQLKSWSWLAQLAGTTGCRKPPSTTQLPAEQS